MKKPRPPIKLLLVLLYFSVLTLLETWPTVLHAGQAILGGSGDGVFFVWLIRWFQRAIFEGGAFFFNPFMNYPEGWILATTDTALATTLPGVPISLLFGPIAGYNAAMWLTFISSGFFMFLWVEHLTGSARAGLLAGTAYAFLPFRIAHYLAGHLNLSGTAWFPLYFWALYDLTREERQNRWRPALMGGISLGLIAFTSMYYLYFTLLISAIFLLGLLFIRRGKFLASKQFWAQAAALILVSAPLLYFALRPYLLLSGQGVLADRSLDYAVSLSASLNDFFLPASSHFLLGPWLARFFDRSLWMEASLYIGTPVLLLSLAAAAKNRQLPQRALILAGGGVIVASILLALGPILLWNNQPVQIHWPAFLQGLLKLPESSPIPLPALWLFETLPFYAKMRAVSRVGVFALVFSPVLAGIGAAWLLSKVKESAKTALTIVLIGLVLLDFQPGSFAASLTPLEARPVDRWLAEQPGSGAVVVMPFSSSNDQIQLFYALTHKKPYTGGFFSANQPPQFRFLSDTLGSFPDQRSVQILKEHQVEYVLVETWNYPDYARVERALLDLGLEWMTSMDGVAVFHLKP